MGSDNPQLAKFVQELRQEGERQKFQEQVMSICSKCFDICATDSRPPNRMDPNISLMPIRFQEFCSLQDARISPSNISSKFVTMESDKHIVVRETDGNSAPAFTILEFEADKLEVFLSKVPYDIADSVIMHPTSKILALKLDKRLEIHDLVRRAKIKVYDGTEDVKFWTWINPTTIGIVTETSVHHWMLNDDSAPTKVFDRDNSIDRDKVFDRDNKLKLQIANYLSDADGKFLLVVMSGNLFERMQLYSTEKKVSQYIDGFTPCFMQFKVEGNPHPSTLLCYLLFGIKIIIMDVAESFSQTPDGNKQFQRKEIDIAFKFPHHMQPSSNYGILYMITARGYVHVFDIETGISICKVPIPNYPIFITTTEHTSTNGVLGISLAGQVLSICLDESTVIPYIKQQLKNPDLALKLASRCNLSGAEEYAKNGKK